MLLRAVSGLFRALRIAGRQERIDRSMHDSVESVRKLRLVIGRTGASSTSYRLYLSSIDNFAALATCGAVSPFLGKPVVSDPSAGLCVQCFNYQIFRSVDLVSVLCAEPLEMMMLITNHGPSGTRGLKFTKPTTRWLNSICLLYLQCLLHLTLIKLTAHSLTIHLVKRSFPLYVSYLRKFHLLTNSQNRISKRNKKFSK